LSLTTYTEIIERRRMFAQRYHELAAAIDGLQLPHEPSWARSNWQSYCVRLPANCDQRTVMQAMLDQGVSTRRGVMCAHREEPYATSGENLRHSEEAQDHCIVLPLFHQMTEADQDRVVAVLKDACACG